MDSFVMLILVILVACIGYVIFLLSRKQESGNFSEKLILLERDKVRLTESKIRLETDLERKSEELGELRSEVKKISKERDELAGRYETVALERNELQSARKYLEKELAESKDSLARHEAEESRKQKEFEEHLHKLASAERALEDERQRIRREDEQEQADILEEQTRIWNDHEQRVLAALREACQKPSIGFSLHDNTSLPSLFTKLKPDAIIPFLGQYAVFDAKKSKSIRTYIPEQVKSTARKYKDTPEIYPTVFFVVPLEELRELKSLSYTEEGFVFHIISPESIEPILASLRKISEYSTIADFDPQDRETIVSLIANYDRHISLQNAANILLTRESIGLMSSKDGLHEGIRKEIANKKESMRTKKLNEGELKKIAQNIGEQERQAEQFLEPKTLVGKSEKDTIEELLQHDE